MKIKICGLTRLEDAQLASDLGADFIGFIFYEKSPRYNSQENFCRVLDKYKGQAKPVAVFVNKTPDKILKFAKVTGITNIQLHGEETQEEIDYLKSNKLKVIKAVKIKDVNSLKETGNFKSCRILLDTWHPSLKGGVGKTFDWNLISSSPSLLNKSMVAGGFNENNIKDFLTNFSPWGIDVSSGIEESPGIKNHKKMRNFFNLLK
ncbi:MAG: hypothetical protein ACD_79C00721G0008 [uncultured bacterium]|nr:MAG: hypothetical protein ACD_79C00721G0008 [uncultured bacterium]